jgi:hypothetical protein
VHAGSSSDEATCGLLISLLLPWACFKLSVIEPLGIVRKWEGEMATAQVLAAKVVIGKSIPGLKSNEHSTNEQKPVRHHKTIEFVEANRS